MVVTIYQINPARDTEELIFQGWKEFAEKGYQRPPVGLYDKVYSYQAKSETPEHVFYRFNENFPADYTGRSLSMSDIVEFVWDTGERSCFFCDRIGFQPVDFYSFLVGTDDNFPQRLGMLKEHRFACGVLMEEIARRVFSDDEKPERAGRSLIQAYIAKDTEGILLALTGWGLNSLMELAFGEKQQKI